MMGAVRSGKTFSSVLKLIHLIQTGPPGDAMIVGVSRGTIQRNVINEMYRLWGWPAPSEGKNTIKVYGRNIYLIGAKDERATAVIYGATLAIAYVDELPKIPKPVFTTLMTRLSIKGAQIICTGNPEGPNHWVKKEYLDNPLLDLKHFKFFLDDNPSLDSKYKENLCKENTGVWYKRLILGEWASAEGMIYDSFNDDNLYEGQHLQPSYYIAGIDYGTSNATACVICAIYPYQFPKIRVVKEYYYDSREKGRCKTDSELAIDIYEELKNYSNLMRVYVDPSALSFRTELSRKNLPIYEANNDVLTGIKTLSGMFFNNQICINRTCKNLIDSIYSYTWDAKASERGEDAPRKEQDHGVDSLRYCLFSHFPEGEIVNERETWTVDKWKREINGYDPMQLLYQGTEF
jgi:PBSX family phage terminase large subunit